VLGKVESQVTRRSATSTGSLPRQFAQSADKRLAKKRVKKVKRGRIVAVRGPKTIEAL
jgi:hypothetical protein